MLKSISGPILEHPGYVAGRTYSTFEGTPSVSAIPAADTIYFYPFRLFVPVTFSAGQVRTGTGGAGSAVKCGIWANSPISARPLGAPLIVDNTGAATTGSSTSVVTALAGSLAPGIYWAGTKATGTLPTVISVPSANNFCVWFTGSASSALAITGFSVADTYSSNMPTIAEGASFTAHGAAIPIIGLTI